MLLSTNHFPSIAAVSPDYLNATSLGAVTSTEMAFTGRQYGLCASSTLFLMTSIIQQIPDTNLLC
jgi:hypothetical protein